MLKHSQRRTLAAIALVMMTAMQPAHSDTTEASLQKALEEAKILGSEYNVNVSIRGKEANLSTYANLQSRQQDKDCKIDAVLLAKKVFDTAPELSRVRVLFHSFDRRSYREVAVTTGDVIAYGSGQIDKDKLLDSLEITEKKVETPKPAASAATKEEKKPPSVPGCQVGEIRFNYTKSWALKTNVRQDSSDERKLVQLVCTVSRDDATITVRIHQEDSPEAQCQDDQNYWRTHRYGMADPKVVSFGVGSKYKAVDITVWSREEDQIVMERHVYFYSPRRAIYSFELDGNRAEFAQLNRDLDSILASLTFPELR